MNYLLNIILVYTPVNQIPVLFYFWTHWTLYFVLKVQYVMYVLYLKCTQIINIICRNDRFDVFILCWRDIYWSWYACPLPVCASKGNSPIVNTTTTPPDAPSSLVQAETTNRTASSTFNWAYIWIYNWDINCRDNTAHQDNCTLKLLGWFQIEWVLSFHHFHMHKKKNLATRILIQYREFSVNLWTEWTTCRASP